MAGYPYAPSREDTDVVARRIGAQLLDSVLVGIIVGVFFIFTGVLDQGVLFFLGGAIATGYWILLEGLWDGRTVGKALTGIKVVKETGEECSVGASVLRNVLDVIDGIFYYLVGFLVMAFSDKRQRVGDRLAGTMVVSSNPTSAAEPSNTVSESQTSDASAFSKEA
jgi:uncharacterized RDD family membrane protein YckC